MSWDVSVHRFSRVYTSIADIPGDEQCLPLGSRAEVRALISQVFPGTDWSDPSWGIYSFDGGSVEFNLGKAETTDGSMLHFMLHVRASDEIVASIVALCQKNNWQAIDTSTGGFLEQSSDPAAGLRAWSRYRGQILGKA